MKTTIDQIFSGDLTFGQSELKRFQWRLKESHSVNPQYGSYYTFLHMGLFFVYFCPFLIAIPTI